MVIFCTNKGLEAYHDQNFSRMVKWSRLKLDFPHQFLAPESKSASKSEGDPALLHERLAAFDPAIVVVYGYAQAIQRSAIAWARKQKKKIAMIADSELRQNRGLVKSTIKKILLPRFLRNIDYFLTVGDANESYFRRYGVEDRRFIRTSFPIDTELFDAVSKNKNQVRTAWRLANLVPEDSIVILMVGKFVHWKRQIDLVRFSNSLDAGRRNITVVLVGSGPEEANLKLAAERVGAGGIIFAGFVDPVQLVNYYAAADIYVHCSEREPHSLAISEATYSGLPCVVSSRCGSYGPTDDVRHGMNGLVYECGADAALRRTILSLVDDAKLRRCMGAESLEISRAHQRLAHEKALMQMLTAFSRDAYGKA